jgi:hypothetical protein
MSGGVIAGSVRAARLYSKRIRRVDGELCVMRLRPNAAPAMAVAEIVAYTRNPTNDSGKTAQQLQYSTMLNVPVWIEVQETTNTLVKLRKIAVVSRRVLCSLRLNISQNVLT